jgi:hypothetical protein
LGIRPPDAAPTYLRGPNVATRHGHTSATLALDDMLRKTLAWNDTLRRSYSPSNGECQDEETKISTGGILSCSASFEASRRW